MHELQPLERIQVNDRVSFTKSGKRRIVRRSGYDERGRPVFVSLSPVSVMVI